MTASDCFWWRKMNPQTAWRTIDAAVATTFCYAIAIAIALPLPIFTVVFATKENFIPERVLHGTDGFAIVEGSLALIRYGRPSCEFVCAIWTRERGTTKVRELTQEVLQV